MPKQIQPDLINFRTALLIAGLLALICLAFNAGGLLATPPFRQDLISFYGAAVLAASGQSSPYDYQALSSLQLPGIRVYFPFVYPPATLLLFAPLAWIDSETAYQITLLLNVILLTAVIVGLAAWAGTVSNSPRCALVTGLALTFSQAMPYTLYYGQINALVALALLAVLHGLVTPRQNLRTGLGLALAGLLKLTPGALGLLLLWQGRFKAIGWGAALVLALIALSLVFYPVSYWQDWTASVLTNSYGDVPAGLAKPAGGPPNLSLNGVLIRLFSPVPDYWPAPLINAPEFIRLWGLALGLPLLAGALALAWRSFRSDPQAAAALLLWVTFLLSPVSWLHHLTYAYIAPVYFVALWWRERRWRLIGFVLAGQLAVELADGFLLISPLTACLPFALYLLCGLLFARTVWQIGQRPQSPATSV